MNFRIRRSATHTGYANAVRCCALICMSACAAPASPIHYIFDATTRSSPGSPSHAEAFDLVLPDFLALDSGLASFVANDPGMLVCTPCAIPPLNAIHFLRSGGSDLIQFVDQDGTNRAYWFQESALSTLGTWPSLPGINVDRGTLVVTTAAAPEPATMMLLPGGAGLLAAVRWRRALRRRRRA